MRIVPEFLNELEVVERACGKEARLVAPLLYRSHVARKQIVVPSGFVFDYASHPFRTARGRYNRAACLHDYLYYTQPDWCTRKLADQIFYEAMRASGVNLVQARAFYCAVRAGGWHFWNRGRRDDPTYAITI